MTYSRYRHFAIERAKPAPTDTQLAAIENLLGARLPASFRDFLRVANGGYLEYVVDVRMARVRLSRFVSAASFRQTKEHSATRRSSVRSGPHAST
jgi:hypothetical protein